MQNGYRKHFWHRVCSSIGMVKCDNMTGFTLVELLFVILIMGILMAIIGVSWHAYGPLAELDNALQEVVMQLNLCRSKAIMTGNNWYLELNTTNHNYMIVNDDGWKGTMTEVDAWGDPWPARSFFPGNDDFEASYRNNGLLEDNELVGGPYYLGSGKVFLDATNVSRITFTSDGTSFNDTLEDFAEIWISLPAYLSVYQGNVMDGTPDQRKHRAGIRIVSSTGNIARVVRD